MRRTKLRNFLIPSVVFHLVLVAFIVIYFMESEGEKGGGSIMVGIVSSEGPNQKGQSAGKSENVKAKASKAGNGIRKEEKASPSLLATGKQKSVTKTDAKSAVKSEETKKTHAVEESPGAEEQAKPASGNAAGRSAGAETAKLDARQNTKGASANPALDAGDTKSAYPDYRINPKPKYPTTARRRGYEGDVLLKVFVLEDGRVGKIELEKPSGHDVLDESALKAVRDWIFIPGTENGREVSSWVTVPISFRLNNG